MENEKIQITFGDGQTKGELIIREVSSVNELPVKAPIKVNLKGVIGAPFEFLSKRFDQPDQINQKRCVVLISREDLSIILNFNENDAYNDGCVLGTLDQHPKFVEFGINTGKNWKPNELGQFLKMNRFYFTIQKENMDLVTLLKSFEAKVGILIEKEKTQNGNFKDNYSGVVTSNLPGSFKLHIPIFKGRPAEDIEVEFYATVNGREVFLQLYSPGACQALEDLRDQVIDEQIKAIRELAPDIAIIEQ